MIERLNEVCLEAIETYCPDKSPKAVGPCGVRGKCLTPQADCGNDGQSRLS